MKNTISRVAVEEIANSGKPFILEYIESMEVPSRKPGVEPQLILAGSVQSTHEDDWDAAMALSAHPHRENLRLRDAREILKPSNRVKKSVN